MHKLLLILLIISIIIIGVVRFWGRGPSGYGRGLANQNSSLISLRDYFNKEVPFNILLLGYAGGNHDGTFLTDSMMVIQVNPSQKTVSLISIPRDIWVKIPTNGKEGGYWKVNAAYALGMDDNGYPNKDKPFKGRDGPGNLAKYVVGRVTGLSIDRFVAVDFSGFKKTVDILGGVDVKVEKTFDDFEYPVEGEEKDLCGKTEIDLPDLEKVATVSAVAAFPCRFEHLHFDAGTVHMDGATALKFVRSRHSAQDGSDFGRSVRQKNVILAARNKVLSLGFIPKIPGFIQSLSGSYNTDLSVSDVAVLFQQSAGAGNYEIKSLALTTDNFLRASFSPDGQYVLVPQDGFDSWDGIRRGLQVFLDPKARLNSPIVKIEDDTGNLNFLPLAAQRLRAQGFITFLSQPTTPAKKQGQSLEKTRIVLNNGQIDQKLVRKIQNALETGEVSVNQTDDTSFDILVRLGPDFLLKTTAP